MRYWALQFGPSVEVIAPASLRERIAKDVAGMHKKYMK
ncbi:MAG: WYL domain-containing protein [Oscillospiraceae bacterium]|nr:WYL domain-containing protein [Oscillospiraceae bacterium]